jgi:hypothetical protein
MTLKLSSQSKQRNPLFDGKSHFKISEIEITIDNQKTMRTSRNIYTKQLNFDNQNTKNLAVETQKFLIKTANEAIKTAIKTTEAKKPIITCMFCSLIPIKIVIEKPESSKNFLFEASPHQCL